MNETNKYKISAVVIAKNEEDLIADCLDSLGFCSEIIVVDNASTDRTSEIVKHLGGKVVNCETRDFSKLREAGLKEVRGDYVLYVDADERVTKELRESILSSLDGKTSAFKIRRQNFYLGNNPWPKIEELERLFLRKKLKGWSGKLHESPVFEGEMLTLDGLLIHLTHRDLTQMLKKTIEWSDIEARNRYEAGHPKMSWWRFPRVMMSTFFDYYFKQRGYRVGTVGLIESIYQSFSTMITYAKLWELQNMEKKQ